MKMMLKEPLIHFLVLAVGLFVLFEAVAPITSRESDLKQIVVTRDQLHTFMQFRSKAFEAGYFETILNDMSDEERERLIDEFVREEALHREATALALDRNDYVIRRRLIQKLEFIAQGFAEAGSDLSSQDVQDYFKTNRQDYYVDPWITFTHVYFDFERHGTEDGQRLAQQKLIELNTTGAGFTEATRHGDRFPYLVNYVEQTPDYVASHFGPGMARRVFEIEPSTSEWRGPVQSPYGSHLVMVTKNMAGRIPDLKEVEGRVMSDAARAAVRQRTEDALSNIVKDYEVVIDPDLATKDQG